MAHSFEQNSSFEVDPSHISAQERTSTPPTIPFPKEIRPYTGEGLIRSVRRLQETCKIKSLRAHRLVESGLASPVETQHVVDEEIRKWIIARCMEPKRLAACFMERPSSHSHTQGALTLLTKDGQGIRVYEPSPYQNHRYALSDIRLEKEERLYLPMITALSVEFDWIDIPEQKLVEWLVKTQGAITSPAVGLYPVRLWKRKRALGKQIVTQDPFEIARLMGANEPAPLSQTAA